MGHTLSTRSIQKKKTSVPAVYFNRQVINMLFLGNSDLVPAFFIYGCGIRGGNHNQHSIIIVCLGPAKVKANKRH
jgi:hypothetical protein